MKIRRYSFLFPEGFLELKYPMKIFYELSYIIIYILL